jgi:transcriptional regulator with XRE-family HTH domain
MRRAAGLSQQRLAELADCSLAAVALFERGYQPDTSAVLPRILAVLNDERPEATTPGARPNPAVAGPTRGS